MKNRKICAITGSRAEYGNLFWVLKKIQNNPDLELQLISTGMHLSPEFGLTYKKIKEDGFKINSKVETLLSSDTAVGIAKSIGLGVIGFGEAFSYLEPDLVIIDGDRYELFAAIQAALIRKIPVAHIGGGDITESSYDNAIRHSLTKMSHIHFPSNAESAERIIQMGENPDRVYTVGSPGIDYIKRLEPYQRQQIENKINFKFHDRNLLITLHPATLSEMPTKKMCQEVLNALEILGPDVGLIISKTNSDSNGRIINEMMIEYSQTRSNAIVFTSMGQELFLSILALADAIVGNSSSGLYEAPSMKTPTVNIGDRQKGRICPVSVINCPANSIQIVSAIQDSFKLDCSKVVNPYGDGESAEKIASIIADIDDFKPLLVKEFYKFY